MAWDFHVGQRVAFIGQADKIHPSCRGWMPPFGAVFTVTAVDIFEKGEVIEFFGQRCRMSADGVFIQLREFRPDEWHAAWLFRPLDERRLDQFRAHLAPKDPEPAVRSLEKENA